jgi:hypothetical protein
LYIFIIIFLLFYYFIFHFTFIIFISGVRTSPYPSQSTHTNTPYTNLYINFKVSISSHACGIYDLWFVFKPLPKMPKPFTNLHMSSSGPWLREVISQDDLRHKIRLVMACWKDVIEENNMETFIQPNLNIKSS